MHSLVVREKQLAVMEPSEMLGVVVQAASIGWDASGHAEHTWAALAVRSHPSFVYFR